jgi:hypothetical protein
VDRLRFSVKGFPEVFRQGTGHLSALCAQFTASSGRSYEKAASYHLDRLPFQNKSWRSLATPRLAERTCKTADCALMNTPDICLGYEASESGEYKPLQIFAKVPRVKIREYEHADDPTLSDEDIAKILAIGPAENLLCQLRASWTNLSCSEILPAELQGRAPDSIENDIAFWIVGN